MSKMSISTDDGLTYTDVENVRIIISNPDDGELHFNVTHEGIITDVWQDDENIGTDSETFQEISDRLTD